MGTQFLFGPALDVRYDRASIDVTEVTTPDSVSYDGVLSCYAYDTVPNQGLLPSHISSTREPGTLGLLRWGRCGWDYGGERGRSQKSGSR